MSITSMDPGVAPLPENVLNSLIGAAQRR
jgi:hypothetical protein